MKNKKIIIICSLILMFIANTIVVLSGGYQDIDTIIRNTVMLYSSETVSKAMHVITFFGSTYWIVALCALIFVFLLFKKKRSNAYSIASVLIFSTVVNNVIKLIIRRPRPEYISVVEHSFSYPSGHTMAAATLYGFIIYLISKSDILKKYKLIYSGVLALLIILVGLSRIYLGAHFFSDVFGGMIVSATVLVALV